MYLDGANDFELLYSEADASLGTISKNIRQSYHTPIYPYQSFAQPLKCFQKLNENDKPEIPKMINSGSTNSSNSNPVVSSGTSTNNTAKDELTQGESENTNTGSSF